MIFGISVWLCSEEEHACEVRPPYMTELELHLDVFRQSLIFLNITGGLYLVLNSTYIRKGVMMSCNKHCSVGTTP